MTKNEQPFARSRASGKVAEDTERENQVVREREQLEQEREQIVERLLLRERLKELFKKHGFTIATVVTADGITIGVLAKILADGASAAANGRKTVGKKVGDSLKDLGKRIAPSSPAWWVRSLALCFAQLVRQSHFLPKTLGCLYLLWRPS